MGSSTEACEAAQVLVMKMLFWTRHFYDILMKDMKRKRLIIIGIAFLWLASSMTVYSYTPNLPAGQNQHVGGVAFPSVSVIQSDLIGRKLSEGTENGYFGSNWTYTIEPGEISGLKIFSRNNSNDYCSMVVTMILKKHSSPVRYKAVVQVDYSLVKKRWKLTLVKSKGIRVIKTNRYFDCITVDIDLMNRLVVKNNIDSPLLVGGVYLVGYSNEWKKFSVVVKGMQMVHVPYVYSAKEYRIDFVELY